LKISLAGPDQLQALTGERIRDKIAASKRKGMWMGGMTPVGYVSKDRTLEIDEPQARRIREIYRLYLDLDCVRRLQIELQNRGWATPLRESKRDGQHGGRPFSRGHLYRLLSNPVYAGKIVHKDQVFEGMHLAVVDTELWDAVQDRLAANRQGQKVKAHAIERSLLAGRVFSEDGKSLTASHAQKGIAGTGITSVLLPWAMPASHHSGSRHQIWKGWFRQPCCNGLETTQVY